MDDVRNMTQAQVASHTLAYPRRLDAKLDARFDGAEKWVDLLTTQVHRVSEIPLRHEKRPGRIEGDINKIKGVVVPMKNQILSRMTEIFHVTRCLDSREERLEKLETPASRPLA